MARIFRRGKIYYCWVPVPEGGTRKVSTQCTDKDAAHARASQLERESVDPERAASAKATLRDAIELLLRDRTSQAKAGKMSLQTVEFYRRKSGTVVDGVAAVLGRSPVAPVYLREITAPLVDDYVIQRRDDGVSESTISKELVTLRSAMRLAKRRGLWPADIEQVFPRGFSSEYKPGERFATPTEVAQLFAAIVRPVVYRRHALTDTQLDELRARFDAGENRKALASAFGISTATLWKIGGRRDEAPTEVRGHSLFAILAFAIATGSESSAIWRARPGDAAEDFSQCLVRGSKNEYRKNRKVPLPLLAFRWLLQWSLAHAADGAFLFPASHRGSFRRTLGEACKRAGIPNLTLTDCRRTHGKWLRLSGVSPANIGPSLGHADGRMAERVYGKASAAELTRILDAEIEGTGGGELNRLFGTNEPSGVGC